MFQYVETWDLLRSIGISLQLYKRPWKEKKSVKEKEGDTIQKRMCTYKRHFDTHISKNFTRIIMYLNTYMINYILNILHLNIDFDNCSFKDVVLVQDNPLYKSNYKLDRNKIL